MDEERLKIVEARLAAAEAQIRALEARVRSLEARNRPIGPKPGDWPKVRPLRPLTGQPGHLKFTSEK